MRRFTFFYGDFRAVLMQIGPDGNWRISGDYVDYNDREGDKVDATATGWQTPAGKRAFIYVPDVPGEVGVMPDRTAVDQKP